MYLGGFNSASLKIPVFNAGAAAINRGCVASILTDADLIIGSYDLGVGQGYGPGRAYLVPVSEWVVSTKDAPFGIAENPIPVGYSGLLTILGMAWVQTDGNVAANDELKVSTGGILIPHGGAGTKLGRAFMTDITDPTVLDYGTASATYALAFVAFGGGAVAYPDDGS